LTTTYKEHRQKILLDQEKARRPETQEQAAIYINSKAIVDEIEPRIETLKAQISALPIQQQRKHLLKDAYDPTQTRIFRDAAHEQYVDLAKDAKNEAKPLQKQIKALNSEAFKTAKSHVESYGLPAQSVQARSVVEKKWNFVGKCPISDCMGFVGMDHVCGLCKVEVCKDCMEPKKSDHTCNTDNILNVRALRKEAKPCPKCAAMISKIDGCDQMWCTQCHTAFSWRTGAEETLVHNPHFYEWMRRTGQHMQPGAVQVVGAAVPAAPACGFQGVWTAFGTSVRTAYPGLTNHWYRPTAGTALTESAKHFVDQLHKIQETTGHVNNRNLLQLNHEIQYEQRSGEDAKRVLRVRRLAKEIDDAEWMKPLERMERSSKRRHALRDIYDMFIQAAMSVMEQFTNAVAEIEKTEWERRQLPNRISIRSDAIKVATETTVSQYNELATYVNEELRKIKSRFSTTVYNIALL
jgi:hypothetical protein